MTIHDRLKAILKSNCREATGGVFEVFMPFDAKTSAYRTTTPCVIFRIEECTDRGFGLYGLTIRVDLLGKASEVEKLYRTICTAFATQQNSRTWSISLASGTLRESWDTDLNVDWGTVTLKGVAIQQ
ncbi:MAG: hypothetical protein IJU38_07070 [Clostridia bacterium]|nr:hypothetical protein [Clostridia bacterium]